MVETVTGEDVEPLRDRVVRRNWEMALDFGEAVRLSRHLDDARSVDPVRRRIEGRAPEGAWSMTVGEERQRRIALLGFAIADVEIELRTPDTSGSDRFFERFLRVFQKGGG